MYILLFRFSKHNWLPSPSQALRDCWRPFPSPPRIGLNTLIFSLISLWSEMTLGMISVLNLLRSVQWPLMPPWRPCHLPTHLTPCMRRRSLLNLPTLLCLASSLPGVILRAPFSCSNSPSDDSSRCAENLKLMLQLGILTTQSSPSLFFDLSFYCIVPSLSMSMTGHILIT